MSAEERFLKATNEEWRRRNAALAELLLRIRAWDMMDTAADGAYWRGEIDKLLAEGHCLEQFKSDSTEVEERTRLRQAIIAAYPLLRRVRDRDVHRVQFFEANAVLGLMDEALKAESPHKPGDVS